jgi:RNA polymerase primary sigma factor
VRRQGTLLSRADEIALARRIERGDLKAKATMIESNLRLVHAVARTFQGAGVPFADLVQEGTVGLVRAVERFDHRRGLKFSTYAVWWIRRSMYDAIAGSKVIRIPAKPNQQLAAAAQVIASLDEPVGDDATPLADLIADPRAVDPSESVIAREERDEVAAMLLLLPSRHREVLARRYGVDGGRVQSHKEIGRRLGIGEERSRQIERESLQRLRTIASASPLAPYNSLGISRR